MYLCEALEGNVGADWESQLAGVRQGWPTPGKGPVGCSTWQQTVRCLGPSKPILKPVGEVPCRRLPEGQGR